MRKALRILLILSLSVLTALLCESAVTHIRMRRSLSGTLFVQCSGCGWKLYDWDKNTLREIPNITDDSILSMTDAGDGKVWITTKSDADDFAVALWDQSEILYEIPLSTKPLAVRTYQNGVLLMQKKESDAIMQYKQQNIKITADCAEIIYYDQTGSTSVMAECGYDVLNPDAFFVSQTTAFTFLKPSYFAETDVLDTSASLECYKDTLCVYENGVVRELSMEAKTDGLRGNADTILAFKEGALYSFSLQSGAYHILARNVGYQNGIVSPDGRYYLYERLHGLTLERHDTYLLELRAGKKARLSGIQNEGANGFDYCWASE